jgi:hypothetical protein
LFFERLVGREQRGDIGSTHLLCALLDKHAAYYIDNERSCTALQHKTLASAHLVHLDAFEQQL